MAYQDWLNEAHVLSDGFQESKRTEPTFELGAHWGWWRIAEDRDFDQMVAHERGGPEPAHNLRPGLMSYEDWMQTWVPKLKTAYVERNKVVPNVMDGAHIAWQALEERRALSRMISEITGKPEVVEPPPTGGNTGALAGRLRPDGLFWKNDRGDIRVRYASLLYAVREGHDPRPALDQLVTLGFTGTRVFAGHLEGRNQTAESARNRLPWYLKESEARGFYTKVVANTDTRVGKYDVTAHTQAIADICREYSSTTLTIANEPQHPTQKDLGPERLRDLYDAFCRGIPTALGASADDESDEYAKYGDWGTQHLHRGRDLPNQIRRVRELLALAERVKKPIDNDEPIGAADPGTLGERYFDAGWACILGALNRLFERVGVFHSEDGLWARPLSSHQTEMAKAYIRGVTCFPETARLTYKNSNINGGWGDSPNERFDPPAVRFYCGIADNRGIGVAVGGGGNPRWQGGWRSTGVIIAYPQGSVYALER